MTHFTHVTLRLISHYKTFHSSKSGIYFYFGHKECEFYDFERDYYLAIRRFMTEFYFRDRKHEKNEPFFIAPIYIRAYTINLN